MASTRREALERRYHRCRDKLGMELHRFVKLEEEEAARFRRRFHIHLCLMGVLLFLTVLGVDDMISTPVIVSSSAGINLLQEAIDRIGQF